MENLNVNQINLHHVIQPIMNLCNNRVYGYEFLLRAHEYTNPELLFSLANKQDKLVQLDKKSIFHILDTVKEKNMEGYNLFINIFPSTLLDPQFPIQLQQIMSGTNLQSSSIVFEISEAENIQDNSPLKVVCSQLKDLGFLIAIDDFGKGGASIKSVIELDPNIVKVDRYITNNMAQSSKKQSIIQLLLDFLKNESNLILEGFESEEDIIMAKKLGVSFGQGFYLGKPKPIHQYLPYF
jgi:EAL domain-containing protein (putative c-di-GMP-specific phosphodiesterase class I)